MNNENRKKVLIVIITIIVVFILSALKIYKCPFYFLFGIPCPACGMTRAIIALLSLNIKLSFEYNALWPLIIMALLLYILSTLNIINIKKKNKMILLYIFAIILIIYNIIRIVKGNTPVNINIKDSIIYKIFFRQ